MPPPMPNAIRGTYTVSGIVPGLDGKQPKYRLGQRIGKNSWLGEHADAGPPREFIVRKDGRIPQPIRGAAGATVGFWRIGTAVPRRLPTTRGSWRSAARASARRRSREKRSGCDAHHSDSANKSVHDIGSIHQGEPNVRPCRPFSQDSSPGPFDLHHRRMSVLSIGLGYHRSDRSDDPTRRHQLGTVPY
jgi:hypothetical protein